MIYVSDTTALSEVRRLPGANPKVMAWASSAPLTSIFLSAIKMFAIEIGALSVGWKDDAQG